jgi:hypothetical protein
MWTERKQISLLTTNESGNQNNVALFAHPEKKAWGKPIENGKTHSIAFERGKWNMPKIKEK